MSFIWELQSLYILYSSEVKAFPKTEINIKNYRKIMQRHIQLSEPGESLFIYLFIYYSSRCSFETCVSY